LKFSRLPQIPRTSSMHRFDHTADRVSILIKQY